jgi:CheY-like chemotaxis protein
MIATETKPATTRDFRVLIADDSEGDRELAVAHLGTRWPVDRASDGIEALHKLREGDFSLLILDWNMPRMGGAEVLRSVRNSGARIAVVVLSGLDRNEITENLEGHDAVYLSKNEMSEDTLQEAIHLAACLLGQ